MKKAYIKPEVTISSKFIRMVSKQGFVEVFWEELQKQRKINPKISEKTVFDALNREYFEVFDQYKYSDYDSFKHIKNS